MDYKANLAQAMCYYYQIINDQKKFNKSQYILLYENNYIVILPQILVHS